MANRIKDITSKVFGKLKVIKYAGNAHWECLCKCGNIKNIYTGSLKKGYTKSCGCEQKKQARLNATKHGMISSSEYHSWSSMKQRCLNPSATHYANYGGRGIKVCKRWLGSFENFYADMGAKPSPSHSIDRINVDGNYTPSNCRWATRMEQRHNRRKGK
jgi:hypothetical protein